MELAHTKFKSSSAKEIWTLHHLTDLHDGCPDHAEKELTARIKEIEEDPRAIWIGGGDYGDLILPGDKRFVAGVVSAEYRAYMARIPDYFLERLTERLSPIASKCIGLAAGNHEATIAKNYHRGVAAELAMRLGIPDKYLGDRGWAILGWDLGGRRLSLTCYAYHGWQAGRSKGRKALQAERDLGAWNADVFFLGHDHQPYVDLWATEEAYPTKNGYKLRQRPRAIVNGGAWIYGQKPPSSEEEKLGWKPSTAPSQSWLEAKNFRPQPVWNPTLLLHLDFGHAAAPKRNEKGRPAGIGLEVRLKGDIHHVGGYEN